MKCCNSVENLSFPSLETIQEYFVHSYSKLKFVELTNLTKFHGICFVKCSSLELLCFEKVKSIDGEGPIIEDCELLTNVTLNGLEISPLYFLENVTSVQYVSLNSCTSSTGRTFSMDAQI